VCKGNLNPRWDEEFYLPIHIQSEVKIRVYDKDLASRDDFMGEGFLDLQRLNKEFESITIELKDPNSKEDLGYIHFEAKLLSVFAEVRFCYQGSGSFFFGCTRIVRLNYEIIKKSSLDYYKTQSTLVIHSSA